MEFGIIRCGRSRGVQPLEVHPGQTTNRSERLNPLTRVRAYEELAVVTRPEPSTQVHIGRGHAQLLSGASSGLASTKSRKIREAVPEGTRAQASGLPLPGFGLCPRFRHLARLVAAG